MKLADLKRIAVGTRLRLVYCLFGPVPDHKQFREVSKVQSNGIYFRKSDGQDSWLAFPKASEFRDNGDGFTVLEDGEVAAQYEFIDASY